jgi:predicted nucleic acid-binding protein
VAVLIDSSVWIAASSSKNREYLALKRLIKSSELIYISHPIQVEVCQGARTAEEFQKLWEGFLGFAFLEISDAVWKWSALNYFKCRKKGLTISTIDCLIATLAREYRVPLWSLDQVFPKIQNLVGFELYG